jgi:beta-galactosidase
MDQGWRFHFGDLPFGSAGSAVTAWRWRADDQGPNDAEQMAAPGLDTSGAGWQACKTGDDTFKGRLGFSWYRTTLATPPRARADAEYILHFEGVDDNATVYLNGQKLLAHQGWDDPFDVPLSNAWKAGGPNELAVLVENTAGMGGIIGPVSLEIANSAVATGAAAEKFDDRSWTQVSVPHDFVVEQPFDQTADRNHGYHPVGVGWYRKEFTIPASDRGKTLWLEFEGVYRNSTVWLNGQVLGHHASGYTSFYYDISQAANYGGKNVLAVRADARQFEGWWYEGGGIYRHVWLSSMSPVHVDHWGTFVQSKVVNGDQGGHDAADVTIETQVASALKANTNCQVVSELVGPTGVVAATMTSDLAVPGGGVASVTQTEHVVQPRLWSLETPNLYRLHTLITQGQKTLDEYDTPFGIRTIRFDPDKGFFLNGQLS